MKPTTLYKLAASAIIAIVALRIIGFLMPSPLTWGLDYFTDLPFKFIAIYSVIGVLAALWLVQAASQEKPTAKISDRYTSAILLLPATGVLFITAAMAFQIQLPLLGDSFIVVQNYENTFKGVHTLHLGNEPAAHLVLSTVLRATGTTTYPAMLGGFLAGEIILGAVFIALVFLAAAGLQAQPRNRNLVFAAVLSLPALQIFFGYAEIYAVPAVSVLSYTVAAIYFLNRRIRIEVVTVALLIALFSHYLAGVLLPSLYYCLWRASRVDGNSQSGKLPKLSPAYAMAQGVIVSAAAIWMLSARESSGGHLLSLTGSHADQYQAYTLFSVFHATELLNLVCLYSPFIVLLFVLALRGGVRSILANERHAFLAVAVAGYAAFLLVAKFDLGLAADWDVTSPYAALAVVLAVSALLQREGTEPERLAFRRIVIAVVVMGFAQTIPWYYLNSTIEPNLTRTKRFLDPRTVSSDGNYQGHFHLSYAYAMLNKPDEAADMWKSFSAMYPNDWRGYQNYAHQAVAAGRTEDPATEEAYQHAFALDTARRMQREFSTYYADRAKLTFQRGNPDSTIYLLQRAIATDSSNAGAWFNLASVYDAVENVNAATSAYFDLLDRAPRFMPGYEGLVKDLLKLGSPEAAVEMGEKALAVSTGSAAIYQSLAEAYTKLNRPADATRARQKAVELGAK